ncbi:hypothetical protein AZE42_06298, partial [Rhizopogon vesiculosus]
MAKHAHQPFNRRNALTTTRALARIIRASVLGEISILPAFCSVCMPAFLDLFPTTLPTKHRQKSSGADSETLAQKSMAHMPLWSMLTSNIVTAIANQAMFAFLGIALMALFPLFLSTPTDLGGVGFAPSLIGLCLAVYGIANGVFQALFLAKLVDWLGPKRLFC